MFILCYNIHTVYILKERKLINMIKKINEDQKEKLYEIGNELAGLYGGSCYDLEVSQEEKLVRFFCIEHGEKFYMENTFEEILERDKDLVL